MGFVMRTCSQFTSIKVLKILYCSIVRSILEYCSQSIQRRFIRYLQYRCRVTDSCYEARCHRFHMLPLHKRREIADIVFLVKIAQNLIESPELLSKINLKIPTRTVRRPVYLDTPRCATNYRRNSFIVRSAYDVNKLVTFPDLDLFNTKPLHFKNTLAKSWFEGSLTV
ncbi:hypothetical protein ABMA27_014738 [Loxostege sticticalis]|uniref:Uncharacterized protein n=1 Tax=Loxostege sticticalis TaxID=481309 RepID=A0ABR3IA13_LOXSC